MKVSLLLLLISVTLSYGNLFDADEETIISPKLQAVNMEEEELVIDETLDEDSDEGEDEEGIDPDVSQNNSEEEAKSIEEETLETVDDEEGDYEDDEDDDDDDDDIDRREFGEAEEENASDYEDNADDEDEDAMEIQETDETIKSDDMCAGVTCKRGKECVAIDEEPKCRCISECPTPLDLEDRVCGTDNTTYLTECELWRTRCLYKRDNVTGGKHLRLSYYGPCKKLFRCSDDEMFEFPTRMRLWLKNIFLQLYDENPEEGGLSDKQRHGGRRLASSRDRLRQFERKSIVDMKNDVDNGVYMTLYSYPVHWKFLVLDSNPPDKYLSRDELEPLLATLIPLEPCTRKFFKEADADHDHMISLYEWGMSLGLKQEDMDLTIEI